MDRSEVEQKVISIVREQKKLPETIDPNAPLTDAGIDSLDALSILFALEETFRISIPDDKARAIKTLNDMVNTIQELVA
jgi:acyl carrier protein